MAKKEELANVKHGTPAVIDYETDAGAGLDFGAQDMAIPFLMALQSGSPQVKRGEQQVPGAAEGDIFNTITGEIFKSGIGVNVIPCAYQKRWVEWRPRESGGGFVAQHESEAIMASCKRVDGKDVLPNGNVIVTTAYHYVIVISPNGDYSMAVISMASTQLKKSRKWNSLIANQKMTTKDGRKFTPAMYAVMYKLDTVPESNERGAWSGWHIEVAEPVVDPLLYREAKAFAESVRSGKTSASAPPATDTDSEFVHEDVPF